MPRSTYIPKLKLETHYIESSFGRWDGDGDQSAYLKAEADRLILWQAGIIARRDRKIAALAKQLKRLRGYEHRTAERERGI